MSLSGALERSKSMRVFEHIRDDVQPTGLGATLICFGAVALGVVGSAITTPACACVLAVAFLMSWMGFPQRFVRVGLPPASGP